MKEVVIVSAVRSPMGRAIKGNFAATRIDDIGGQVIKAAVSRALNLDPNEIEELIVGCAFPEGEQGMNVARNLVFLADLPQTIGATTVNRFCSSSLQAIEYAAAAIMAGNGDVQIAAGIESMSHVPMGGFNPSFNSKLMQTGAPEAYISMGITAENVAAKYGISRQEQDQFAYLSHQKAVKAIAEGKFKDEIVAIEATGPDGKPFTVDKDEGPRADTSVEKLATLKPAFREGGSVTAGNSSPLTDGAAAVVLMSAERAKALGIKPLARVVASAGAGLDPAYMGLGPIPAVKKALKRAGLTMNDIDIVELNEAFAAQSLAVVRDLEIPAEKLNPHGGAIALGHPLGCTGARIMTTLVHDLHRYNKRYGVETMCVGGGQGLAMIIERM